MSKQLVLFTSGVFQVTAGGLVVAKGTHDSRAWSDALLTTARARSGVQWAIGDLLLWADTNEVDEGLVESTMEATGLKRGTLLNLKSVARTFPTRTRRLSLSWSHHALVAGFEEDERQELLGMARTENLSWDELRHVTRDRQRERRVAAMAWPEGKFGVLLSDNPWPYEEGAVPPDRALERHYPPMPIEDMLAMAPQVQAVTADNAVLYLWVTGKVTVTGEAVSVMRAWGFDGRSTMVWVKDIMGMGYWARQRHEALFIGVKGDMPPPEEHLRPDSVITAARGTHSEKPVELYEVIERCYPGIPKVELFARDQPRNGWSRWGNTLDMMVGGPDRNIRLREEEAVPA